MLCNISEHNTRGGNELILGFKESLKNQVLNKGYSYHEIESLIGFEHNGNNRAGYYPESWHLG